MQIQLAACREQGGKSQALAVLHGFCTGAARFCTGLHYLFFEWEATAAASSESRNRHTRCYPMPKGCAGISPWVSSHTRRRRKDRTRAAFSASTKGSRAVVLRVAAIQSASLDSVSALPMKKS